MPNQQPEPIQEESLVPSPEDQGSLSVSAETDAEALLNFQRDGEQESMDPLMQAIQQELGQQLAPTGGIPSEEMLNPYTDDEVFRAVNLTKAYGQGAAYNEVIKGISFTVKEGEYVVIYGPSGSGKSTLLHMLAGLEKPTRGEIRIRNVSFSAFTEDEMALYHREGIGLVFQSFNLLDSLRVWENVAFPLMLAGAPEEWRQHEALKMLERFGLEDFASHYPNQLSGGQQQRVSLARALIHDPALLLVDEPTGNLDTKSSEVVVKEIERLHKQERRTIILVTHSQVFLPYANRVFYIRDGTLLTSNEQNSVDPAE
ncbi:MAG TPA: ABC transporter ATP-binding protein [Verrucomicrobiae bacterium]|nr:ABC transporter ATP-binding protein [Verrucomicrobiae bacterium]